MEKISREKLSLNPFKIFNESLTVYQKKFKSIVKISLITTISSFLFDKFNSFIFSYANRPRDVLFLILYVLFFILLNLIFTSIINLFFIYALNEEKEFFFKNYTEKIKANVKNYLIASVIINLVILTGLIFFIIPGIFFYISFIFTGFVIALEEEKSIKKALSKSKDYVKGNFTKLILCFIFILFIIFFVEIMVFTHSMIFRSLNLKVLEELIIYGKILFFNPINFIYLFLIYKKIKSSKEENNLLKS